MRYIPKPKIHTGQKVCFKLNKALLKAIFQSFPHTFIYRILTDFDSEIYIFLIYKFTYMMLCTIWYLSYSLKKLEVQLKQQPSMGVFHIFWIAQMVLNRAKHHIFTSKYYNRCEIILKRSILYNDYLLNWWPFVTCSDLQERAHCREMSNQGQ